MSDNQVHEIQEEAVFDNEKEAIEYLKELSK